MTNDRIQSPEFRQNQEMGGQSAIESLENRTLYFAKAITALCLALPKTMVNHELAKQLLRSGTSIGANYREANESLGKKDFIFRLKITLKEAKETTYWLRLVEESNACLGHVISQLLQESVELRNILSSIISKFSERIAKVKSPPLYFVLCSLFVVCSLYSVLYR